MIHITIEKRSGFGNQQKEVLGYMTIANDGTGTETVGHYNFAAYNKALLRMGGGRILGFPRKQAGAWKLLALALQQMYPSTQPGRRRRWPGRKKQQRLPAAPKP